MAKHRPPPADDAYETASVQSQIEALLRERRSIGPGEQDNFNIFDTRQISETLQGTTRILTAVMGAVAAVSLIVGGIGIMNIMLVSVTERTREIGIRKALGATRRAILTQFLVEAVVVCMIGGLIGIGLSVGVTALINQVFTAVLSPATVVLAFGICVGVGVLFGFIPAWTAARSEPIEALRYE